jgi:5-methylcytosine-specific restriction endonuclease McrA
MRACLGCGCPSDKSRCPACESDRQRQRKAEGQTGERGSTHASRLRRYRVLERAGHRCFYCSAPADIADHYIPLAKGGPDSEENMVAACQPCNSQKSDRTPNDFMQSDWLARRCEEVAAARRDAV